MKKKIILTFLIAIVISTIYGISTKNKYKDNVNENKIPTNKVVSNIENEQNNIMFTIHTDMLLVKPHKDIKSLKEDSEIIVRGVVLDTTSYISGPGVITEYKFKVNKSYNNNAKTGDIITIATGGGIVDYEEYKKIEYVTQKDFEQYVPLNAKIKITMGENNLIEKSKEYIIFANTQQVEENGEIKKMYFSINSSEGQFDLDTINNKLVNLSLNYNKSIDEFEKEIL